MQGHIYFIMGISGSGKGTLRKNLEQQKIENLVFSKSYVTRPMREGEVNGDIYNFISLEDFQDAIEYQEFLEYEFVHNLHYYGTKYKDVVDNGIKKGLKILKELDMRGLKNILKNHPRLKKNITTIFLDIREDILDKRIEMRGASMSDEELSQRKESLKSEKEGAAELCDYIIDTSDISPDEVLTEVLEIIKK